MISSRAMEAMFAQETEEVFLLLLTIEHEDMTSPLRLVNNSEDIVSGGDTYTAYPFQFELPSSGGDSPPRATIKIDNVHRDIVSTIRSLASPPEITISVILASQPDTPEASFGNLTLEEVSYDALEITGELAYENVLVEPFPGVSFSPDLFPGLL